MRHELILRRMNHTFIASNIEGMIGKCAICKRAEIDHTPEAKCDKCSATGVEMMLWREFLYCPDCVEKQRAYEQYVIDTADERVKVGRFLAEAQKIDASIRVFTDIFNAKTVAIEELRKAIDADDTIPQDQKYYKLGSVLSDRYTHLKDVIHSKREEITAIESEVRAIQTYFNTFANNLRAEEREKLRIQDSKYVVQEPKKITQPKAISTKNYDKATIRTVSAKYKLPEAAINMLCVAKNISPEEAAKLMLAGMAKAKEETNEQSKQD